jgi:energy-coupling factor transporter ATP-binding protein EcfA2
MPPELETDTTYFRTYEEREEAFRESVSTLVPRKYSGPRLFWKDFRRISHGPALADAVEPIAYITGNPRDCLVFGTPVQELSAARMCALGRHLTEADEVIPVARRFDLEAHLHQPVRTLSGGETVKVALAKAFIAVNYCCRLTIASPFSWLSQSNRSHLFDLLGRYHRAGLPVTLLALEGEDSVETLPAAALMKNLQGGPIHFRLSSRSLVIRLTASVNPLHHADRHASVEDFSADLVSPCLLLGENGQGKSLVAKALAGAIGTSGEFRVAGPENAGPVRILLQDVVGQTLLRDFEAIRATAGRGQGRRFERIYREIMGSCAASDTAAGPIAATGRQLAFHSLLEMKAALMAVRLCGRPGALIMDEPDWGLSRPVAVDFVFNVIAAAQKRGIPVVLISHKPWWRKAVGSILRVRRSGGGYLGDTPCAFTIRLEKVERNIA